jgi:uncharacterized membrane protein YfcA
MTATLVQDLLALASGSLVGFTLGLVGGGGSILAVPLLIYLVGVTNPHIAIGTSAMAVAVNAAASLIIHARAGTVKWRCASVFTLAGAAGAFGGSTLGRMIDPNHLLAAFAVLMIIIGAIMLRNRDEEGMPDVRLSRENLPRLVVLGLASGVLSGFFGIGGGFLIVPALIYATGMPVRYAIGSSLVAVTAFGLTTSLNYAAVGLVDLRLAALFIAGGIAGSLIGARATKALAMRKGALNSAFAVLIFLVAAYMLAKSLGLSAS